MIPNAGNHDDKHAPNIPTGMQVLIDFDGTITTRDTTDHLLEKFADPLWLDVEDEWVSGKIGSKECLSRQVALINATPDELRKALSEIDVDPGVYPLVGMCEEQGVDVKIVSDGLDFSIDYLLDVQRLNVPVFANALEYRGNGKWQLSSPHASPQGWSECRSQSGTCKCGLAIPANQNGSFTVLVGDGRSDFCVSERVDHVLSKGSLTSFCRENKISHSAISSLSEALTEINHIKSRNIARPHTKALIRKI